MSTHEIDPALVGIWVIPGQPQTYEVSDDGGFHIAEPAETMWFENGGTAMIWGTSRFTRSDGEGQTPIGTWLEDDTGDAWDFTADHGYSILSGGDVFTGIWALRDAGSALWTRELRAQLSTRDDFIAFHIVTGERFDYGYTVGDEVWRLLDPETGSELTRYIGAELMVEASGIA